MTKTKLLLIYCILVVMMFAVSGCGLIRDGYFLEGLVTVPQMTVPQVMMGDNGMYCYYYFDKFSDVNYLADKMSRGESESYRLAVEGYQFGKAAEAILAAVEINKDKKFTYLKITYIGSEQYKDTVKEAVESIGAEFYFYKHNK